MYSSGKSQLTVESRAAIEGILKCFKHDNNRYKSIDFINYMTHYVFTDDSEDKFCYQQLFRNMETSFREEYTPNELR